MYEPDREPPLSDMVGVVRAEPRPCVNDWSNLTGSWSWPYPTVEFARKHGAETQHISLTETPVIACV
jgi:hypothetical protein